MFLVTCRLSHPKIMHLSFDAYSISCIYPRAVNSEDKFRERKLASSSSAFFLWPRTRHFAEGFT
jgi:hypothetical protein